MFPDPSASHWPPYVRMFALRKACQGGLPVSAYRGTCREGFGEAAPPPLLQPFTEPPSCRPCKTASEWRGSPLAAHRGLGLIAQSLQIDRLIRHGGKKEDVCLFALFQPQACFQSGGLRQSRPADSRLPASTWLLCRLPVPKAMRGGWRVASAQVHRLAAVSAVQCKRPPQTRAGNDPKGEKK
jgi:hypothetical protein